MARVRTSGSLTKWVYGLASTKNGVIYRQVVQTSTNNCLEWDRSAGYVRTATCDTSIASQWWSPNTISQYKGTLDNYYGASCLSYISPDVTLGPCANLAAEWTWDNF